MSKRKDCPECEKGTMVLSRFNPREQGRQEHTCNKCGHVKESTDRLTSMFSHAQSLSNKMIAATKKRD